MLGALAAAAIFVGTVGAVVTNNPSTHTTADEPQHAIVEVQVVEEVKSHKK